MSAVHICSDMNFPRLMANIVAQQPQSKWCFMKHVDRLNKEDDGVTDTMKARGQATIMILQKSDLSQSGDVYKLSEDLVTIQEDRGNQCDGTPWNFGDELDPSGCSGTLIPDRYVVTADHCQCLPNANACANHYIVFFGAPKSKWQRGNSQLRMSMST